MFDKMKALMDMQKKMQEMKRQLDSTTFEVESADGLVKISMNGSQEIQDIKIQGNPQESGYGPLGQAIKEAFNQAIKRSHELAAQKMKDITGFSFPGLV